MDALAPEYKTPDEIDELVLNRAKRGDEQAFRQVIERYHLMVYNLLWRMVEHSSGQARAEELVQDTFLSVFRALPKFDTRGPAKLSSWILTIAMRLALNDLRRARKRSAIEPEVSAHLIHHRPDKDLERREIANAIREAIAALSPDHRAVFILREYHGEDYAAIAAALQIDIGTVKSRLSRARAALRSALEEVHDDD